MITLKKPIEKTQDIRRKNQTRKHSEFKIGDQVYVQTDRRNKINPKFDGPFTITKVNENDVHIQF